MTPTSSLLTVKFSAISAEESINEPVIVMVPCSATNGSRDHSVRDEDAESCRLRASTAERRLTNPEEEDIVAKSTHITAVNRSSAPVLTQAEVLS